GLAMLWVSWAGRERDEIRRDDSEAAMARMQSALQRPRPTKGRPVESTPVEPTHGVALRGRGSGRPAATTDSAR
ncbi:MAG: hypothetical protein ACRDP4_04765, partial [Nocardioidaceae bacterium]